MNLPEDVNLEKAALNIIINDNKKIPEYFSSVNPEDNFDEKNKIIAEMILQLHNEKKSTDFLLIDNKLCINKLQHKVGTQYLSNLIKDKPDKKSFTSYLGTIKTKSAERKFIREITGILNTAYEQKVPLPDLINTATEKILEVRTYAKIGKDHIITPSNVYDKRMNGLLERIKAKKDFPKTGFSNLDNLITYGFAKKKLSLIVGRPRMYKSAFKVNLCNHLSTHGFRTVSMCLEQDFMSETDRLQALRTGIKIKDIGGIRKWKQGDPRVIKISNDAKKFQVENLFWFDKKGYYLDDIYLELLNMKMSGEDIDVVFIDLFDRVKDLQTSQNKADAITKAMGKLSDMSVELDTHFCCVVQLNREVGWKRPTINHIKSGGAYEEYADLILMMYRPIYCANKGEVLDDTVEIIVGKDRDGEGDQSAFFRVEMEICKFWETISP